MDMWIVACGKQVYKEEWFPSRIWVAFEQTGRDSSEPGMQRKSQTLDNV